MRRTLDIGAFGINAYVAPNAGDDVVEEHTERSLGHEEVYVVLSGRATFTLDDETLDAPAGTVVFVRDAGPETACSRRGARDRRCSRSAGRAARHTSRRAWEDYFAAERHRTAGDYDAYLEELEAALERRPDHPERCTTSPARRRCSGGPTTRSCILRQALELRPELAEHASVDEDFASLRDRPDWPLA